MGIFARKKKDPFTRGCTTFVGEILATRCKVGRLLLVWDADSREKHGEEIVESLTRVGFVLESLTLEPNSEPAMLADSLAKSPWDVVFAFGDAFLWRCVEAAVEGSDTHYVVMPTTFRAGLRIPPYGARIPDSFFCDADLFLSESEEAYQSAIPYAVEMGLAFDKWFFDTMYSSFNPAPVVRRAVDFWVHLIKAEQKGISPIRARRSVLADVVKGLDESLTDSESLAIGLVWEARIARAMGVARENYLADLTGMFAFWGFPLGIAYTEAELLAALADKVDGDGHVVLYLPRKRGECVPYGLAPQNIVTLLG